jgi:hypothetical protein
MRQTHNNYYKQLMSSIVTEPSVCIPRALANVSWKDVKDIFEQLIGAGSVERVDLVRSKNDDQFCRIFVHFRSWPVNKPEIASMRDRLLADETVKLVYDNPWFWKCVKSKVPKPERTKPRAAPFIMDEKTPSQRLRTIDDFVADDKVRAKLDHGTPSPDEWRCGPIGSGTIILTNKKEVEEPTQSES